MAKNLKLSSETASISCDAACALADNGFLRIYTGAQPATPDDGVTTQVLLAQLSFGAPAFNPAVDGVAVATAMGPDPDAAASGDAAWYRVFSETGDPLWDGSVGVGSSNFDMAVNSVSIQQHANVSMTSFKHTVTK